MSRFLICSFALVLLYPAGIDMYLVGLRASPPISMPAKRSCILRSPYIWRGWQLRCYLPVKWPIVQEKAGRHTRRGAIYYCLGVLFTG